MPPTDTAYGPTPHAEEYVPDPQLEKIGGLLVFQCFLLGMIIGLMIFKRK